MLFTPQQIHAFCNASHDRNPLHVDMSYAKRSQFGRPVVYGMASVLYALGAWAAGRSFRLTNLRAIFRKPLFESELYALDFEETVNGSCTARYCKGKVEYAVISFSAEITSSQSMHQDAEERCFEPQTAANDHPETGAASIVYRMNPEASGDLEKAFAISGFTLPVHQLATLLWASYHVGMILPGRQALFSELQVSFSHADAPSECVRLDLGEAKFQPRFNRYTIQGKGPGIESIKIIAFCRPLPVEFQWANLPNFPEDSSPLQGRRVFISGATRGFGAAMARMCAKAGASLFLNYRNDEAASQLLMTQLREHGTMVQAFAADMGDASAVAEMVTSISSQFGGLDLIVNNAAPPIRDLQFEEQSNVEIQSFVSQNLGITLETIRQLLPVLSQGGQFLHISTKYLKEPVLGFAHYLAAKAAQEALIQAIALEYPKHRFVVVRLPRILTDQTNLPFDFDPPKNPGEIAMQAIQAVARACSSKNYQAVDLFEAAVQDMTRVPQSP